MNNLSELLMEESLKTTTMNEMDSLDFICTGSILACSNVKECREFYELHGSLPAKLYVLVRCVEELTKDANVPVSEIVDFIGKMSGEVANVD